MLEVLRPISLKAIELPLLTHQMLDRLKQRFSISKKTDGVETLASDGHISLSKVSFSSLSRSIAVHIHTDDEEQEGRIVPLADTRDQVVPPVMPVTARPENSISHLFSLPTELLLQLQLFLTPCSEVSLRQSCSRFFRIYSCPSFYLAGDFRFIFLCHLERDSPNPSRNRARLVCGHCRDLHARSAFPSSELKKPPQARDCRQVWLCPHRTLGIEKAVRRIRAVETLFRNETLDPCTQCKALVRNRSAADRSGHFSYVPAAKMDLSDGSITGETLLVTKIGILQKTSPSDARGSGSSLNTETFPTKDLVAALSGLDFRICPHVRLGDPYFLTKFCRACLNLRILRPGERGPPCISYKNGGERARKCSGRCYVKSCKTSFMFQTRESLLPDVSGRRQIWLIVAIYRWLGPLIIGKITEDGAGDAGTEKAGIAAMNLYRGREWLDHTVDAAEMVEMRVKWKSWMKEYGRKCMPDWSICQLHPEDCHLR